jgi:hypothetical protein
MLILRHPHGLHPLVVQFPAVLQENMRVLSLAVKLILVGRVWLMNYNVNMKVCRRCHHLMVLAPRSNPAHYLHSKSESSDCKNMAAVSCLEVLVHAPEPPPSLYDIVAPKRTGLAINRLSDVEVEVVIIEKAGIHVPVPRCKADNSCAHRAVFIWQAAPGKHVVWMP